MPLRFTANVESGKDLSVKNYILNTARAMELFYNLDDDADITKMSREQLVECVKISTSFYEDGVAECKQQIGNAKKNLKGEQLETELLSINEYFEYAQMHLDKYNRSNYKRSAIAGALYDNLPNGSVEVKVGKLTLNEPNEFEELFGKEYKNIDRSEPNVAIKMLYEIIASVKKMTDEQKAELLDKKIGYETKSYQYDANADKVVRARYDGMIEKIKAWSPVYENNEDKELENEVAGYFAGHKKFALSKLIDSKKFDCNSEEKNEKLKNSYEHKINALQKTRPYNFTDQVLYDMSDRVLILQAQMAKTDKGNTK